MRAVVTKKLYRISYEYSEGTATMNIVANNDDECKEIVEKTRGDWKISSFEVVSDTIYLFERL